MLGRHATMESYKSSQVFAIAGENQHGMASGYDMNQQVEHGSSNSHTDSANSQVGFKLGDVWSSSLSFRNRCGLTRKAPVREPSVTLTTQLQPYR